MSTDFLLNRRVLVSDANHIATVGINAHENTGDQPNIEVAVLEHRAAVDAFQEAGIHVEHTTSPPECQDGVFTANWGLTWNGRCVLSNLPNMRKSEEPFAEAALKKLGYETRRSSVLFSGQGDSLIIANSRVIIGSGYRNDPSAGAEIKDWLGLEPIVVRAKPKRSWFGIGKPVRNPVSGLWDSYYYDLDLAVSVIRPNLLAVCFEALTREGRAAILGLANVEVIPVEVNEARYGLACNLVSTGETVIMVDNAPILEQALLDHGLKVITQPNHELKKGGGGFRCISLALY